MCVRCRFVRREKEIAMARCEASEEEALRHKQRVEYQDREMKELQEALNAEREKMQVGKDGMKGQVSNETSSIRRSPVFGARFRF